VLAAAFVLTAAHWGRPVQRIAAGMAAFLPLSLPLLALLWLGRRHLFLWITEPERSAWLNVTGLFARDGLALAGMTALSLAFLSASIRGGRERSRRGHGWLATAVAIGFFPAYALLAIDLAMSLDSPFTSTIFPVIYLAGSFYAAIAATAVLGAVWRRSPGAARLIAPSEVLHLGNLLWAFCMFLGYLWWSQYLTIWMGNLPHEVAPHMLRWQTGTWRGLAWASLTGAFIVPFFLLFSRGLKAHPLALALVGGIGAGGVLLQRFLDVLPALGAAGGIAGGLVQAGVTVGFLGLFALPYLWLTRRAPLFPVDDPLFIEELLVRDVVV
jgi:hypothetical protein